jgi:hypothetical protein
MATARVDLEKKAEPEEAAKKKVVNPTSIARVTVAFPFSKVQIAQQSDAVTELAGLVAELARALAKGKTDPAALDAIAVRADEIAAG